MEVPQGVDVYGADFAMKRVLEARDVLPGLDIPNRKSEYWKYSPPAKVLKGEYGKPEQVKVDVDTPRFNSYEVVIENGKISSIPSDLPAGVSIMPMADALSARGEVYEPWFGTLLDHKTEIFAAINMAHPHHGVAIHVDRKTQVDKPIHIVHKFSGSKVLHQPRDLVVCGSLSELEVITTFVSKDLEGSLVNGVTELAVEDGARLTVQKLQMIEEGNFQVLQEESTQGRDSTFSINTATLDGDWVRNNLNIRVQGENCQSNLNGLYLLGGKQHVDNHTIVDHKVPHCESNELYKGVLDDKSTGVFNGKVFVRPHAQKTNAFQSNANVVLSDTATMNSKPELEIYADDVQCSHGSTTGQMDDEALYYLRTRGLSYEKARKLLIRAFVADVVDQIENEEVQEFINGRIEEHFDKHV